MKKLSLIFFLVILLTGLFSSSGMSQEETRRRSSGPRRQLATIVFAGLGGAIIGLSTLSFYGRPQEQLTNIAVGFAVGIIAGTTYVTVKSATTRDYYDEKNPQPYMFAPPLEKLKAPFSVPELTEESREPRILYGPLLTKVGYDGTAYGGSVAIRF